MECKLQQLCEAGVRNAQRFNDQVGNTRMQSECARLTSEERVSRLGHKCTVRLLWPRARGRPLARIYEGIGLPG